MNDIKLTAKGVQIRQTGHHVPNQWGTVIDGARLVQFYRAVRQQAPQQSDGPTVCFYPVQARPWYFAWSIAYLAGARLTTVPEDADIIWYFEDKTTTQHQVPLSERLSLNKACCDVSKSHIAAVFEQVFGRTLRVDPSQSASEMVMKSEINGAHDGMVITGPCAPVAGMVYQRLVDNHIDDDTVEDLRTTIMGGKPVLVFRKRRASATRFANANSAVLLADLRDIFSVEEIAKITAFAEAIGLDAGGLDVLRDRHSGEIFIVDVNKTDMGPPLILPMQDKLAATRTMATAFLQWVAAYDAGPVLADRENVKHQSSASAEYCQGARSAI